MGPKVDIGSDFLGYRIEELIGRGGMGVVYRAYDLRLKRTVALKLITPALALDERSRASFSRESELAMSLEHPNVVPIYDAGDFETRFYLAMRLVEGQDLRALLRSEGALEPARALTICRQVASALDAAHVRDLVHRDVKPSNVLLDESEHVYLADFGLTRPFEERSSHALDSRSLGTPAYVAPEQIGGGPVDGRADVYSLGCLLYECLTGEVVFPRASRLAAAWAHLEEEPPRARERRPELPDAIDAVIATAMAKGPQDRYPTCAALVDSAEEALGLRLTARHDRRRGLAAGAAFAVLLGLAAALVFLFAARHGHRAPRALYGRANTLVRIDPRADAVSDVVNVGARPMEAVLAGPRVWVYNHDDPSVSEIDALTRRVRRTTPIRVAPVDTSLFSGPVLAADSAGAWVVGLGANGAPRLARVFSGGRRGREYPLDLEPMAVAVGYGAVWVVGSGKRGGLLLRIDPSSGHVTGRTQLGDVSSTDTIGVGYGAVWVIGSTTGAVYRIDPSTGRLAGTLEVGHPAGRPSMVFGNVWIPTDRGNGETSWVDSLASAVVNVDDCCRADWGENRYSNGWVWWYDWPTGSVYRQHSMSESPRAIRVVENLPMANGLCVTSIAIGAGAVWATVTAASHLTCPR